MDLGEATGKLKTQMLKDLESIKTDVEFFERYIKNVPEEDDLEHFNLTCAFADCIHAAHLAIDELEYIRFLGMPRQEDYAAGKIHPKFVLTYDGDDIE